MIRVSCVAARRAPNDQLRRAQAVAPPGPTARTPGARPAAIWASAHAGPGPGGQINGKVERFHRTLLEEWAYQRPYASDTERQAAFTDRIDWYNYHRPHTGITGQTPASRVTNLSEQHT